MSGHCWRFSERAPMGLAGVEVIEQACFEGDHVANGLAEVAVREVKSTDSSAEEALGRKTQETARVD